MRKFGIFLALAFLGSSNAVLAQSGRACVPIEQIGGDQVIVAHGEVVKGSNHKQKREIMVTASLDAKRWTFYIGARNRGMNSCLRAIIQGSSFRTNDYRRSRPPVDPIRQFNSYEARAQCKSLGRGPRDCGAYNAILRDQNKKGKRLAFTGTTAERGDTALMTLISTTSGGWALLKTLDKGSTTAIYEGLNFIWSDRVLELYKPHWEQGLRVFKRGNVEVTCNNAFKTFNVISTPVTREKLVRHLMKVQNVSLSEARRRAQLNLRSLELQVFRNPSPCDP